MATIYIRESEIVENPHTLIDGLRAGNEFVIDGVRPLVIRAADEPRHFRTIDEAIAGLRAAEQERGYALHMGKDFADDLEQIVAQRAPSRPSAWD